MNKVLFLYLLTIHYLLADDPFSHFKPYEIENIETEPEKGSEQSQEDHQEKEIEE